MLDPTAHASGSRRTAPAGRRRGAPVHRRRRDALPAQPQRRHHRQGRGDAATPATSCAPAAMMLGVTAGPGRLLGQRRLVRRAYVDEPRPRPARARCSTGSAPSRRREVQQFGAPSLITRSTNDVTAGADARADGLHHRGVRADHDGRRRDHGAARGLRPRLDPRRRGAGAVPQRRARGQPDGARTSARCRPASTRSTACCASRSPASAWSARSCASPTRPSGSAHANDELTDVAVRAGRWLATMFPLVMLVVNVSSVAVIWFGGHRVDSGQMQIGALTAFLSYLMQILMSVMMATFMLMMVPRASVCGDRITEVLDTAHLGAAAGGRRCSRPGAARLARPRATSTFSYPGAEAPVLSRRLVLRASRSDGRRDRLDRRRQVHAGQPGPAALRRHRPVWCASAVSDVRDVEPEALWAQIGLVPQKAYLFSGHGAQQPAARQARRHRGRDLGRRSRSPRRATSSRRCPTGSTPRSPRAAPTSPAASASGSPSRARWSAGPGSTCSTTRSRRSTWPPTPGCGRRCDRSRPTRPTVIVAQRVTTIIDADLILVLEDGRVVGRGTHQELLEACTTYQEIVTSQMTAEEAA